MYRQLISYLSNADDWEDMEIWANHYIDLLREYLEFANGIPVYARYTYRQMPILRYFFHNKNKRDNHINGNLNLPFIYPQKNVD